MKSVRIQIFLVQNFPHSDWIRIDKEYLSVFCSNVGIYGPEKLWMQTLLTQYDTDAFLWML